MHTSGEAEGFYRKLASPAIGGIEAVGNDQRFVQLLQKLGHEVCVGDAAQIRASYVRKQKTDRRDAKHILHLLVEGRFPRIWIPDVEMRDHRQLLIHRHKLVQIRTRIKNELQHLARDSVGGHVISWVSDVTSPLGLRELLRDLLSDQRFEHVRSRHCDGLAHYKRNCGLGLTDLVRA
jgi:transposase